MGKVFAGEIAGKEIVNIDGTVLGELENLTFDLRTGRLVDLVVKPDPGVDHQRYREEGKYVLIPFGSVVSVKDCIVVDEGRAVKSREVQ